MMTLFETFIFFILTLTGSRFDKSNASMLNLPTLVTVVWVCKRLVLFLGNADEARRGKGPCRYTWTPKCFTNVCGGGGHTYTYT